ncbi:hypothetical protein H0H93_010344 [Arthromyces matolae]|nr:hypothetical protein H0H93_010344 [Arthromyces matolae]
MWLSRRCLLQVPRHLSANYNPRIAHKRLYSTKEETDELGIPLKPTWSVHELLSSYPKPTLSSATLTRLHNLSALTPPKEGTIEHEVLKNEMEELIRLVEAVKLVDTEDVRPATFELPDQASTPLGVDPKGRELLRTAARTADGFYVVDSDKKRL